MPSPRLARRASSLAATRGCSPRVRRVAVSAHQSQIASERPAGPTVDFVALDASGSPAADLQPSDVEIRIADRVRTVRTLRRVSAAPAPTAAGAPARVPPPYGTNDNVAAGRRFVLVIDQESFAAGREPLFRNAIEGLLAELTPADRTMVAALPFGGVMVPFTSDTARIRLAAGRVTGQGSRTETGSDLACRTRRFLESLDGLLRDQARSTRRRRCVLFTAGLAGPRRDAPMGVAAGHVRARSSTCSARSAARASAARANVYVMQPADIGIGAALPRPTIGGAGDTGSDNPLEGIEHLAGATGGARLPLDATGTGSLLRVARESSAYYVAELEPVAGEVFGRSRRLSVRVARPRRHRPRTPRRRPHRHGARQDDPSHGERHPRLDRGRDRAPAARRRLHRARPGRQAARGRRGGAGGPVGHARVGGRHPDRRQRPRGHALARARMRPNARSSARCRSRRAPTACAPRPSTPPAGRARRRWTIDAGLTQVGALSLGSLLLSVSRDGVSALQLEFGIRADRTGVVRHLRGNRGPAAVGDARSVAHARRPRHGHGAAGADPRRRLARRRDRRPCPSAPWRPATTSCEASSASRTARRGAW